ncbi:MAG: HRDC domain-containing protein [Planctomycetota bacterium]
MRFRLFQYPLPADPELPDLTACIASHRIASVTHHVVSTVGGGMLVFVVEAVDARTPDGSAANGASKVDYRELLSEPQFAAFCRLRSLRRAIAEEEGVPVYAVFSNAQLAEMVRRRARAEDDLMQLAGVGRARVARYGARFAPLLEELHRDSEAVPEAVHE